MPGAVAKAKDNKNFLKRQRKKKEKELAKSTSQSTPTAEGTETTPADSTAPPVKPPQNDTTTPAIQLSTSEMDIDVEEDPLFLHFKEVMDKFAEADKQDPSTKEIEKPDVFYDDDDIPDEEEEKAPKISKKARKMANQLSIAELKALVKKPELVEWTDVNSNDPRLLVAIKSYRNSVPVPNHWSLKREYLSSKRGIEKPPFALPKFIVDTGIAEMRDAALEKQAEQTLKQKQRERVQGKTGKLDIDYAKLYDAFFKFQTKPSLTRYGEVYYEGKEYETNLRHLRPGELSDELKEALSIPPGAPPPWLINQQRFGPPPSYPALKIAGLNAPPPPGGQWGFHPGGYGKPPVDEFNRPLYGGDVYGVGPAPPPQQLGEPVERTLWGELQPPEEEEEEEEDEDEDEEGDEDDDMEEPGTGIQTASGLETPGGFSSAMPSEFGATDGMASEFTLRKQRRGTETEENTHGPRSAYQVLPEHNIRAQGFFGGEKAYDLTQSRGNVPTLGQDEGRNKRKAEDVDVSVDLDELERNDRLDKNELSKKYDSGRQEQHNPWGRVDQDDLSQMIADESRKRLKKDEERRKRK